MELTREEQAVLENSGLFHGISPEKLSEMLSCLQAFRREFAAGELVLREGELVQNVGLVLSGHAASLKTGRQGEELILTLLEQGSFLGVLVAASREKKSPVSVKAETPLSVVFFPAGRLSSPCEKGCPEHGLLVQNFLTAVAEKSLTLNDRIDCLVRRGVREKVQVYLMHMAKERGSPEFTIPLDREAMANYLNVDRTALSRELSRMKAEGLIDYRKSFFRLLKESPCTKQLRCTHS